MNINDEAVEAAARCIATQYANNWEWYLAEAREILEAAAPHMLHLAKREAWDANLEIQRLRAEHQEKLAQAWQEGRQARHDHMIGKSPSNPYLEAAWERGREDGYHHKPNPYTEAGE
jgi:hypothetical protein